MTLTHRVVEGQSVEAATTSMLRHWSALVAMVRKTFPSPRFEYGYVVELTQAGWPHLHVLCRATYIDQRWLSAQWARLHGAPVVDIRKASGKGIAEYVAKYVGKDPIRVGNHKRYGFSQRYRDVLKTPRAKLRDRYDTVRFERGLSIVKVATRCARWGWRLRYTKDGSFIAARPQGLGRTYPMSDRLLALVSSASG